MEFYYFKEKLKELESLIVKKTALTAVFRLNEHEECRRHPNLIVKKTALTAVFRLNEHEECRRHPNLDNR